MKIAKVQITEARLVSLASHIRSGRLPDQWYKGSKRKEEIERRKVRVVVEDGKKEYKDILVFEYG